MGERMTDSAEMLTAALNQQIRQADFAEMVEISPARVSQLVGEGVLQAGDTALGWLRAYTARLNEQVVARTGGDDSEADPILEGALLNRSRREAQEIRNAQALAAHAPRELLDRALSAVSEGAAEVLRCAVQQIEEADPPLPEGALRAVREQFQSAERQLLKAGRAGIFQPIGMASGATAGRAKTTNEFDEGNEES